MLVIQHYTWVSLNFIINFLKINKIYLFIASWKGHEGTVRLLADEGADLNIKSNSGWTAFQVGKS